jgi:hypothetical protein
LISTDEPESATADNISGFSKVKTPPPAQNKKPGTSQTVSVNQQATSSINDKNTGGLNSIVTASGNQVEANPTSISGLNSASSNAGNSSAGESASAIPDGDEMDYVVNPVGTVKTVPQDADWALSLATNPGPMIDALEGGRPGGNVNALMALLRQTQGPFNESEEKEMMNQYSAHSNTDSPKAKNGIRSQSELLLQAMIHRQLMIQAAWEYDFAISQMQMAENMQDEDEKEIAQMLAEIQQMIITDQQTELEKTAKKSETGPQIPTAEEIEEEKRENVQVAEMAAIAVGSSDNGNSSSQAGNAGNSGENDEISSMVARYHALREEHRMLVESTGEGSPEATAVYREAMDLRKKLEAKGVDVFNYKKPDTKTTPDNTAIPQQENYITPSNPDPKLTDEQNQAIAEHEYNINATIKTMNSINKEMAAEKDPDRKEALRLQALHMAQNIHDSKDLIESIRTGTIVKTRGPWDEHSAVVLAETSRKLREDFQRASQMQASYARMLKVLDKYNPQEAAKFRQSMSNNVVKGIFDPGGFAKAQQAIDALHAATKGSAQIEQQKLEGQQTKAFERLEMVERHLKYAETLKSGCDKAVFVGTLFTGMAPGLVLSMAYEGACTGIEKGPKAAIKNMAIQGATMLAMAGAMKAGSWGITKLLNPKVVQSEVNAVKKFSDTKYFLQEKEMNQALINNLKDRVKDFNKIKTSGKMAGTEVKAIRQSLDDAVAACNSSPLAKRMMKNELTMFENQIKSGATRDYSKLRECLDYQKVFDNRLQKSIYPRADADMISKLRAQGYNVEKSWLQEYRNACSRGVNADRDLGLIAAYEKLVTKSGQPVSMNQFMDEAQKVYNESYKMVTGRSAKLADQSITTSAHGESFPVSWLKKKMEGPFTTLDPPVTPQDFKKAGSAIYTKVENALKGSDPAFVKMQKACASLSKDLKTKVLDRLKNPPANTGLTPKAQQQAYNHWQKVQKVMDDFATGNSDPFTTMKKLEQLTGSTNMTHNAREVQKLLNKLGGN